MSAVAFSKRSTAALGAPAAIVALGVAELIVGIRQQWRSPMIDVGNRVIDNVPPFVKDFAIETFGTNDKPSSLLGIGVIGRTQPSRIGRVGRSRRIPTILCSATGAPALWFAHRIARPLLAGSSSADTATPSDPTDADQRSPTDAPRATRRELLVRSGGVLAALAFVGTGAGAIGRTIRSRFSATESLMNGAHAAGRRHGRHGRRRDDADRSVVFSGPR